MLRITRWVSAVMFFRSSSPVAGSSAIWPLRNTNPPASMAGE